jgi:hypothetical protein
MKDTYNYSNENDEAVDYFLGILDDCMQLNCSEADDKFINLEMLLKQGGAGKTLIAKLRIAKGIFEEIKPYNTRNEAYIDCFRKLEHALADVQEGLFDNKKKEEPENEEVEHYRKSA